MEDTNTDWTDGLPLDKGSRHKTTIIRNTGRNRQADRLAHLQEVEKCRPLTFEEKREYCELTGTPWITV